MNNGILTKVIYKFTVVQGLGKFGPIFYYLNPSRLNDLLELIKILPNCL
ncbi:hypothetical protein NADRNF5_0166 [Nitrosopumilus adriaticus]|uniref:Uncharacterized protein n=1 Tax=Nitrosopumilus adriaticus TaxID=1580092 RepID=A0A0D5C0M0_9ARCH|nr:hypothetical protein NADRNF5_0166 [Nitrosopumilus adriaticus]